MDPLRWSVFRRHPKTFQLKRERQSLQLKPAPPPDGDRSWLGATYLVITGTVTTAVLLAGLVYGLGPTVVIFAKHTDKACEDKKRAIITLPVVLGNVAARYSITLLAGLQIAAAVVMAVVFQWYGMLVIMLAAPTLWKLYKACGNEQPQTKPFDYPDEVWPLWYATHAFVYARTSGFLLIVGFVTQGLLIS